jgi:hypothetical protein
MICSFVGSISDSRCTVRSFKLDTWSETELAVMRRLGNSRVNAVLAARLLPEQALTPNASGPEREAFINAKYVARDFLRAPPTADPLYFPTVDPARLGELDVDMLLAEAVARLPQVQAVVKWPPPSRPAPASLASSSTQAAATDAPPSLAVSMTAPSATQAMQQSEGSTEKPTSLAAMQQTEGSLDKSLSLAAAAIASSSEPQSLQQTAGSSDKRLSTERRLSGSSRSAGIGTVPQDASSQPTAAATSQRSSKLSLPPLQLVVRGLARLHTHTHTHTLAHTHTHTHSDLKQLSLHFLQPPPFGVCPLFPLG